MKSKSKPTRTTRNGVLLPKRTLPPTFRSGERVWVANENSVYFGLIGTVSGKSENEKSTAYHVCFPTAQLSKKGIAHRYSNPQGLPFWPEEIEAL